MVKNAIVSDTFGLQNYRKISILTLKAFFICRKWLKYHPDKWHGLCEGEKEVASFIIKEYGQVFQFSYKVGSYYKCYCGN